MNIAQGIADRPSAEVVSALRVLAKTARVVGEQFFPTLVESLAQALDVRWVLVCRFDPSLPEKATTMAFWDNGLADNFIYDLEYTPCADVRSNGVCSFADGIQERYPKDAMLVEMGAQSYAGTPLRSTDGRVLGLIAVLDEKPFHDGATVAEIIELFSGRAAAELERLSTASLNERLGRIVEASVSEAYVFDGTTYQFELVNHGARENLGYTMEELRSLTPWDLKPEYAKEEFIAFVEPLKTGKVSVLRFETVHLRKDGTTYPVAVQLQYFPDAGSVFFASITDETERKEREAREDLLLREINHRAKNVLAVVQVLARQTARRKPQDYIEQLEARLAALSASHDVLVDHTWQELPFEELVRSQLGHFSHLIGSRISLLGSPFKIQASAAQPFGMALHELATNAAKYGALSNDVGTVVIHWSDESDANGERIVVFSWKERGGPEVAPPDHRGFGSTLIERSLAGGFGGEVSIDYPKDGFVCTFRAPAGKILAA